MTYLLFSSVKSETVTPGCNLPQNFSGHWINTANIDADVFINQTHIIETWHPDIGRSRRTVYVCKESRDSRILLTRLNVDGWYCILFLINSVFSLRLVVIFQPKRLRVLRFPTPASQHHSLSQRIGNDQRRLSYRMFLDAIPREKFMEIRPPAG